MKFSNLFESVKDFSKMPYNILFNKTKEAYTSKGFIHYPYKRYQNMHSFEHPGDGVYRDHPVHELKRLGWKHDTEFFDGDGSIEHYTHPSGHEMFLEHGDYNRATIHKADNQ